MGYRFRGDQAQYIGVDDSLRSCTREGMSKLCGEMPLKDASPDQNPLPRLNMGRYLRFDWAKVVEWLTQEKADSKRRKDAIEKTLRFSASVIEIRGESCCKLLLADGCEGAISTKRQEESRSRACPQSQYFA
jgi:hypothetical protein